MNAWTDEILLYFESIQPGIFSVGRQRWVNETLADLLLGYIETGEPVP